MMTFSSRAHRALFVPVFATCSAFALCAPAMAEKSWGETLEAAKGQSVYWNAWGGDEGINAYIDWVGARVAADYGINLTHVKLSDTASAVQQIETEFAAGRDEAGGSVDLIWINGENFARLKRQDMLGDAFSESLPNYALADTQAKVTLRQDFSQSVDGLESPWGLAQFTFLYDTEVFAEFPGSAEELLAWAEVNEGRLAYPAPPAFVGTTFLKQIALETLPEAEVLYAPASEDGSENAQTLAPLWDYMDALHAVLWRGGQAFPNTHVDLRDLFNRGEIDALLTFNPGDATSLVAQGVLPDTIATAGFDAGSIGNAHFVAIPGNSSNRAAAQVVANFLLSPEAQARKADPNVWGDTSVLALSKLSPDQAALFPANAPDLGPAVLEPHASWVPVLEAQWQERYGQ